MDEQLKLITGGADLMEKYGFLGVGLVLFVVLSGIAWARSREIGVATMIVGILFIVAFGVFDLLKTEFPDWLGGGRSFLSGSVLSVPNTFAVQLHSDQWRRGYAFVRRENDPNNGSLSRQSFLFALKQPPKCLAVAISSVDPNNDHASFFAIGDITAADMTPGTEMVAKVMPVDKDHFKLEVWREKDEVKIGQPVVLPDLGNPDFACPDTAGTSAATLFLDMVGIRAAYAQPAQVTISDFSNALQSDDVFLRWRARRSLAELGSAAFDKIGIFLNSNVYRLQLGALVALSYMPAAERAKAPASIRSRV